MFFTLQVIGSSSSTTDNTGNLDAQVSSTSQGPISLQAPASQASQMDSQTISQSSDAKPVVQVSVQGNNVSCSVTLTTMDTKDSLKSVQISTAADSSTGATLGSASDRSQTPSIASTSHRSQTPSVASQVYGGWLGAATSQDNQGAATSQDNQAATSQPAAAISSNPTPQTSSPSTSQGISTTQADTSSSDPISTSSTSSSSVVLSVPVVNASTSVSDPVERITAWLKDTSQSGGGAGNSTPPTPGGGSTQQAQPIVIQPIASVPPSPTIPQDPWAINASSVVPTSASSSSQSGSQILFSAYNGGSGQQSSFSIPIRKSRWNPHSINAAPVTCGRTVCPPPLPIQSGHVNSMSNLAPPPAHMNLTTYMNPLTLAAGFINLHPQRAHHVRKAPTYTNMSVGGLSSSNGSGDSSQDKDKLHVHSMFLSKVLVGCYTTGNSGLRKPPPLDPNDPYGKAYDSCVDNIYDPRVFVVFDSAQCYPEYVIEYTNDPGVPEYY